MNFIAVVIGVLFLNVGGVFASCCAPYWDESYDINTDYAKSFYYDGRDILMSPCCWDRCDWQKASVVVGVTALLFGLDGEIRNYVQHNRVESADNISRVVRHYAEGAYFMPALAALYSYGYYGNDIKAREVSLLGVESAIISGVFVQALKMLFHRERANSGEGLHSHWKGPSFSTKNVSFPSGHTATAFALSTVVAEVYSDHTFVPYIAYGLALFTGLSRINDNMHYASDVFVGAVIGHYTAKMIMKWHGSRCCGFDVCMAPMADGVALQMSYNY